MLHDGFRRQELDGLLDGRGTSAAVECDQRGVSRNKVYHYTRRRELYTTGCSEPRESDMDGREVFPQLLLRCEGPTPVAK